MRELRIWDNGMILGRRLFSVRLWNLCCAYVVSDFFIMDIPFTFPFEKPKLKSLILFVLICAFVY